MRPPRFPRLALPILVVIAALGALVSCENNDTTTAPGALASITINAPDNATSGQAFTIDVNATNVGVQGVHNTMVTVTVPAPLVVTAVDPPVATTATFSGGTATWNLGTLDSNSNETLHVTAAGALAPGAPAQSLTVQASLTADGVAAGDAVSTDTVQLNP